MFSFLDIISIEDDLLFFKPKYLSILKYISPESYKRDEIINIIKKFKNKIDNSSSSPIKYDMIFFELFERNEFRKLLYELYPSILYYYLEYNRWNIPSNLIEYYQNGYKQIFDCEECEEIISLSSSQFRNFFIGLSYCKQINWLIISDVSLNYHKKFMIYHILYEFTSLTSLNLSSIIIL